MLKEVTAKSGQSFYIHRGILPNQVAELIGMTVIEKDPIKLDGDENRFKSRAQYNAWRQKGRAIYTLTDDVAGEGVLSGIFWAGVKHLPQRDDYALIPGSEFHWNVVTQRNPEFYRQTYAFRLYGQARGDGLSHPVLTACLDDYLSRLDKPVGFWLEVSGVNPAALRMDQKQGYEIVSGLNSEGRLVMARSYQA